LLGREKGHRLRGLEVDFCNQPVGGGEERAAPSGDGASVTELLSRFVRALVAVFLEASPYILLGFAVAAVLQILVPVRVIQRFLGKGRVRPIFTASLLGIPLPLCSCSVLPTALSLRKRGAGRGATLSFLVSTPETGVDSIALTYGLMGPLMAFFRPVAAFVSAIAAGFAAEAFGGDGEKGEGETDSSAGSPPDEEAHVHTHHPRPTDRDAIAESQARQSAAVSMREKLRQGFRGAFVEIFDETSHWLFAGLVISALISVLLPAEIVTRYLSAGPVPLLLMLVIGIPLYICASASTPIAAALMIKGLSPGAALVFLLAGPATNVGSLAILTRFLGRRVMVIYITTIAVLSLALGALLDVLFSTFGLQATAVAGGGSALPTWLGVSSAVVFAGLLFFSFRRVRPPEEFRKLGRGLGWLIGFRPSWRVVTRLAAALVVVWLVSLCVLVVPPGNRALVRRFGAPAGEPRGEGLHFKWPPPVDTATLVAVDGVRRIEMGFRSPGTASGDTSSTATPDAPLTVEEESLFLCGDENLLATQTVVQYRITDAERYVYGFDDPEQAIKWEAIGEMVEVFASQNIDGVYSYLRGDVEDMLLEGLRRRCESLDIGVDVLRFSILSVHAPPEVHAAFRDVASAQEDKQTAINVAQRYQVETVNLARGEAARQVEEARSYSISEVDRAQGESESLKQRARAFREWEVGTKKRLYLETMEEVLSKGRKIIRPGWRDSGTVDLWISAKKGEPVPVGDILRGSQVRQSQSQSERAGKEGE